MIIPEILYSRAQAKDLVTQQNEIVVRTVSGTSVLVADRLQAYTSPRDRIFILSAWHATAVPFAGQVIQTIEWEYVFNGITTRLPFQTSPNVVTVGGLKTAGANGEIWLPGGGLLQVLISNDIAGLFGITAAVYGITIPRGNTTIG